MNDSVKRSQVARRYPYLQGLLMVPVGLWFAVVAVTTSRWWPWSGGGDGLLVVVPAGVVAVLACYAITRYYESHFGRVEVPQPQRRRQLLLTVAAMATIVSATLLGEAFRAPVNLYGIAVAVSLVGLWGYAGVLRTHHLLLAGGLAVLSLLPLGGAGLSSGSSSTTSMTVVLLGMAVATVCAGLIDHSYLARWLGPARPAEGPGGSEISRAGI
jgi:hypothetical protein